MLYAAKLLDPFGATLLGELSMVWIPVERSTREITDATPVPDGVLFLGTFVGLTLVLAALQVLVMAAGILIQAFLGHFDFKCTPRSSASRALGRLVASYLVTALATQLDFALAQPLRATISRSSR